MKLTQQHFYFGAILSAILQSNPDASLAMLQRNAQHKGFYTIETNKSQNCCIYFKHAGQRRDETKSWQFVFTDKDFEILDKCHEDKAPTFIYLLCHTPDLKNCEIAVLNLIEFRSLNKDSITVRPKDHSFIVSRGRSPSNNINIPRNRIEKDFDVLINEVVQISNGYYCPNCKIPLLMFK